MSKAKKLTAACCALAIGGAMLASAADAAEVRRVYPNGMYRQGEVIYDRTTVTAVPAGAIGSYQPAYAGQYRTTADAFVNGRDIGPAYGVNAQGDWLGGSASQITTVNGVTYATPANVNGAMTYETNVNGMPTRVIDMRQSDERRTNPTIKRENARIYQRRHMQQDARGLAPSQYRAQDRDPGYPRRDVNQQRQTQRRDMQQTRQMERRDVRPEMVRDREWRESRNDQYRNTTRYDRNGRIIERQSVEGVAVPTRNYDGAVTPAQVRRINSTYQYQDRTPTVRQLDRDMLNPELQLDRTRVNRMDRYDRQGIMDRTWEPGIDRPVTDGPDLDPDLNRLPGIRAKGGNQ